MSTTKFPDTTYGRASVVVFDARKKFLRRQIERAREIAEHYDALNDPDSAWVFTYWADHAELELDQPAGGDRA
jgi:hypothetical protein